MNQIPLKFIKKILFLLPLFFACLLQDTATAQSVNKNGGLTGVQACIPYTTPVNSSAVACGAGYTGMKYFTTSQTCPDGKITTSREYDTSNCVPIKIPSGPRCDLNPDLCAGTPEAKPCAPGRHWFLPVTEQGVGAARCVKDDFACPTGSKLVHDSNGEPSCEIISCPSNQVVQADGTCGCPAGLPLWDGSSCRSATCDNVVSVQPGYCAPPMTGQRQIQYTWDCRGNLISNVEILNTCSDPNASCIPSSSNETAPCDDGSAGFKNRTRYVDCPGNTVSYSSWGFSGCAGSNTGGGASCSPGTRTEAAACDPGYTGSKTRSVTTTCPGGATTFGDWNTSSCVPSGGSSSCTPFTGQERDFCPTGFIGYRYRTVNRLCPSGATYGDWDLSACIPSGGSGTTTPACQNGGTDYPTCTLPHQVCWPQYYGGVTYWVYAWGEGSGYDTPGNSPYNQATGLTGWNSCTPSAKELADWNNR